MSLATLGGSSFHLAFIKLPMQQSCLLYREHLHYVQLKKKISQYSFDSEGGSNQRIFG